MRPCLLPLALLAGLLPVSATQNLLVVGQTYNTGYDGSSKIAGGQPDNDFSLTTPPATFGTPVVADGPVPSVWNQIAGAQFISPTADQAYPVSPAEGDPKGTYIYEAILADTFAVPTTLTVSGEFEADDYATAYVDGDFLAMTPGVDNTTHGFTTPTSFSQTFTVDAESLPVTIDFVVENKADTTDHIAINPTGLLVSNLKFTVDNSTGPADMPSVPEPEGGSMMFAGMGLLIFIQRLRSRPGADCLPKFG
jgi:hypothetical protein